MQGNAGNLSALVKPNGFCHLTGWPTAMHPVNQSGSPESLIAKLCAAAHNPGILTAGVSMGPTELGPTGLKDIHKECLRLAGRHYSSKEIARLLGISKHTVDQRLRFATRQMGATSRFEAARRFCDADAALAIPLPGLYDSVLYDAAYIPVNADDARAGEPGRQTDQLPGKAGPRLQDAQTPYLFGDASKIEALFSVPVSTGKAPSSPLSLRAKSVIVVGTAAISLLAFGAAVAALEVLSRI